MIDQLYFRYNVKYSYYKNSYNELLLSLKDNIYNVLSEKTKTLLLPFVIIYLRESGFLTYTATKTKYRNRLNTEPDFRLQLSKIKREIAQLNQ